MPSVTKKEPTSVLKKRGKSGVKSVMKADDQEAQDASEGSAQKRLKQGPSKFFFSKTYKKVARNSI
jgi:hypothetical protein